MLLVCVENILPHPSSNYCSEVASLFSFRFTLAGAHHELCVLRVEDIPRRSLRASQKHAGCLAFHLKRNIAAANKKKGEKEFHKGGSRKTDGDAASRRSRGVLSPNAGVFRDVDDVKLVTAALLLRRRAILERRARG